MSLPRHVLVGLVAATLVLGTGASPSVLVCRLLCLLQSCPLAAPSAAARENCCPDDTRVPSHDQQHGTNCRCALVQEGFPNPPQTSADANAATRVLLSSWILEPARLAVVSTVDSCKGAMPVDPRLADPGPPGGALGTRWRSSLRGAWSAAVLGCARI
jgi:hypothetical protein